MIYVMLCYVVPNGLAESQGTPPAQRPASRDKQSPLAAVDDGHVTMGVFQPPPLAPTKDRDTRIQLQALDRPPHPAAMAEDAVGRRQLTT